MPTTSNFGWTTPADTDLVKDGAAAIRTLGNGIDTSLVDLKGGTTGQVLSKNSNTDLDYTWVTPNVGDITEVQAGTGISVASGTGPIPVVTNSMATEITAKGDLIVGTGSGTFDNLPVGTNGHTLVADSSTATGLKWAAAAAGGMTLLASGAHSGTTLSLTSIPTTYNYLVLFFDGFDPSADERLGMRFNQDSTANRHSTWTSIDVLDGSFVTNGSLIGSTNDSAVITNNIIVTIPNYAQTNGWKFAIGDSFTVNQSTTTNFNYQRNMAFYNQTTAITSLDFYQSGGGSFAVNYKLYGVK